jgi:LSD1 subclass zinc finger protein
MKDIQEHHMAPLNGAEKSEQTQTDTSKFQGRQRGPLGSADPLGALDRPACVGCRQAFIPLTDGASKTLCRVCQAELRRGMRP